MTSEELIEVLKVFDNKKVEQLNEKARNLFYAIMNIADERDLYKKMLTDISNALYDDISSNIEKIQEAKKVLIEFEGKRRNKDI